MNVASGNKNMGWLLKYLFFLAIGATLLLGGGAAFVFWHFSRGLPDIITAKDYRPLGVTRIIAAGGNQEKVIGEFFKEKRYVIPYEKIPEIVSRAFICAEDDQFFSHLGINLVSMVRASIANFRAGRYVQGGSTITQQVAKSLLMNHDKNFGRKIREVILASRIERNLSKQQILYLYLNQIYLGHGAYGVQAAAQTYFRKDISQVNLAEAAILAGMPQAPSKYSPLLNPKKAKERQLYVLRRMVENKYITQDQMKQAAAFTVRVYHDEDLNAKYAPYLIEYLRRYLSEKYSEKAIYEDALTVKVPTTPELLLAAHKSLQDGLAAIDKRIGYRGPIRVLKSIEEIEKFLRDYRIKLIERKLHSQMLMPDGKLDAIETIRDAGYDSDTKLIDLGELYEAVVTGVDDHKQTATVLIGAVRAEIPMEQMRWAKHPREDHTRGPDPRTPSQIVSKGAVILVRPISITEKGIVAKLEQEPEIQGALFSMDVQTGKVLAMDGGYDFEKSQFNRAVQALRQPGSAFKPIIYASALEKGYTPASIIVDSPIVYENGDEGKWKPSNFEEKFYGDTTFRQALIKSRNIPTIKIVQNVQVPYVIEYAKRLGMNSQFNSDLSISLGSMTISLLELTKVYALFPRLGRRIVPAFFTHVLDRDGNTMEETKLDTLPPEPHILTVTAPSGQMAPTGTQVTASIIPPYPPSDDPDQVLDPRVAFVMTHLMKEVVAYGTGHEASGLGRPAAGKTGTTNDSIDAWFMAFTPHVVTGVWVGFDNQRSIGPMETGARAALPIWLSFMKDAVKPYPESDFVVPSGVVFASIDPATGKQAAPNSSTAIKEAFIEGTQPTESSGPAQGTSNSQSEFFKEDVE